MSRCNKASKCEMVKMLLKILDEMLPMTAANGVIEALSDHLQEDHSIGEDANDA